MPQLIDYQSVSLSQTRNAQDIIAELASRAQDAGLAVIDVDSRRPWGGFVRFDTADSAAFIEQFFAEVEVNTKDAEGNELPLSPKFLLVAPHQRLSWQRHQRRSEVWRFLTNDGAYSQSKDPEKQPVTLAKDGDIAEIKQGYCHRLISQSDDFVLVAEIWRHTNLHHLSDEDDNERLQDDYNR